VGGAHAVGVLERAHRAWDLLAAADEVGERADRVDRGGVAADARQGAEAQQRRRRERTAPPAMLEKAQTALLGYNLIREQLRAALGDHNSLDELSVKLDSLSENCLVSLGDGLTAMTQGDLTVSATPVTEALAAAPGQQLGALGETFNTMLARAQGGIGAYNEMRDQLAGMLGEIRDTSASR
jgi:methyl-accepting chemotaxis protein